MSETYYHPDRFPDEMRPTDYHDHGDQGPFDPLPLTERQRDRLESLKTWAHGRNPRIADQDFIP